MARGVTSRELRARHAVIERVPCPACGAGAGDRCREPSGRPGPVPHQARRRLQADHAARLAAPCPACGAVPGAPCQNRITGESSDLLFHEARVAALAMPGRYQVTLPEEYELAGLPAGWAPSVWAPGAVEFLCPGCDRAASLAPPAWRQSAGRCDCGALICATCRRCQHGHERKAAS